MKAIGRKISLGIAKETTRGTAESSATFWLPLINKNYDDKVEVAIDESCLGIIETPQDSKVVKKLAGGSIEGNVGDKSIGLLLYNIFGSVSSENHGSATGVKVHTFSMDETAQHQSLTLFLDDPTSQDYKYALAMLEGLEFTAERGKFLTIKADIRSKNGSTATLTPSFTAENNFLSQHLTFKVADSLADLGTADSVYIQKASLKFNHNLEDDDVLGLITASDIVNTEFSCEGTIELVWENETYKTLMLADTAKAIRFDWKNTDVEIGTGIPTNPELQIDLAKVKFQEVARKMDNKGLVTQTLKFKAFYSLTDSKMFQCVLTNTQTSY